MAEKVYPEMVAYLEALAGERGVPPETPQDRQPHKGRSHSRGKDGMASNAETTPTRAPKRDFTTITEAPAQLGTADQLRILYTRYHLASRCARDRDVLEAACGAGMGLGYLAKVARSVVGGDIEGGNCRVAAATYSGRPGIAVTQLDVQQMPFPDRSFDVVVLFEALYYIAEVHLFLREARRVLRPNGTLLMSSVNNEWKGFNPSPFCTKYFGPHNLAPLLKEHGFDVAIFGGFPDDSDSALAKAILLTRRAASRFHLIPKTMNGKQWLKRIFYGKLKPIPAEISDQMGPPAPLMPLGDLTKTSMYRFYYAAATIPGEDQ